MEVVVGIGQKKTGTLRNYRFVYMGISEYMRSKPFFDLRSRSHILIISNSS